MDDLPRGYIIKRGDRAVSGSHPLVAAPMAGVFDPPFRMVLHGLGLELSFTEMISARAVYEGSKRTRAISDWLPLTGSSGAQIFGADPQYLSHAAREMERMGYSMIDLNAGCPKRKVTRTGAGSALLRDPDNLLACMGAILDNVKLPAGVKIRSGYDVCDVKKLRRTIKDLEGLGVSYIAVHARTARQQYSGEADREIIEKAAGWVDIPIIASGDVRDPDDVNDYLGRGARAVMFARGALGDPAWFVRALRSLESNDTFRSIYPADEDGVREHLRIAREHLEYCCGWYGEKRGCIEFRKHLVWYVRRFRFRAPYREKTYSLVRKEEFSHLIDELERDWTTSVPD